MDREISPEIIKKRRRRLLIKLGTAAALIAAVILAFSIALDSSIPASSLYIHQVDRGNIEISVNCAGSVSPLIEEIISAPINSRILEVYKNNGEQVSPGEPILKLELSDMETQYRQKLDEREMMASKLVQLRVRTDNSISELVMQQQVGRMQLSQLESELEGERHLHQLGAGTADKVRQAELAYQESKLRLEQLAQKIENERKNADAELRVHELELSILEKTLEGYSRLLNEARIMSPREATLTFINKQIGSQVSQGERLAVVADLTRFKVQGEISERHRSKLSYGGKVLIRLPEEEITGAIYNIDPAVSNGIITFVAVPDDPGHPELASGIKLDVDVIHGRRHDVLRLPPGKWYTYGKGDYFVWVVSNGKAEKRRISTGDGSYDFVEITSGLTEGESVITGDMEKYQNKKTLKIK